MNRPLFALVVTVIVIIVFVAMWLGWRARSRRDASVLTAATAPVGAEIASFSRVFYVSTTPVGEPLMRVAVPGLKYRGRAEVSVRADGVTIQVDGEAPVSLLAGQVSGSGSAARRVGKAVEQGGLALIKWQTGDRDLESSFRFDSADDHKRFISAVDQISLSPSTSQEGAK